MTRALRTLACVTAACIVASCSHSDEDYRSSATETTPVATGTPVAEILADANTAFDIYLVGDGTGPSMGGWVYLTVQDLAQQSGRPADIRDWDVANGQGYVEPPIHVADGEGSPITLWNASVSRNIGFIDGSLPGMRPPAGIDLVLVNNGLDMGPNTLAAESIPLMRTLRDENPDAAVVAVLQPTPTSPELSAQQSANTRDLEVSSRKNDFQTIDVRTPVSEAEGTYDGDDRYANQEGQRIWATTVSDALNTVITVPNA